jgi:putative flavoprotein involved in K+ transport
MGNVVVCGAGAAGLSAAASLCRAGLDPVILERSDRVGASWRSRYPALRLNTPGWMSTMPGYRASARRYGEFPSRDDWIRYLEDYSTHHRLEVRFDTEVHRVDRSDGAWRVETCGGAVEADAVVIAIGFDHDPYMPDWPGLEGFGGELIHASAYHDPEPYRGKAVLVVGTGVTGSEVAHLIATGGAARVRVACRTPPHIVRRKWLGAPIQVPGVVLHHLPLPVADRVSALAKG